MRYPIVLLVLMLLAVGACERDNYTAVDPLRVDSLIETSDPAKLSGKIFNELFPLSTLENAAVSWGDYETSSDTAGAWELSELPAGKDSIKVELEGFESESRWVEMAGADQIHSFALMPVDTTPPPAPLAFSVVSSGGEFLQLEWEAPDDSSDLAGYLITKSPGDPQSSFPDISSNAWLDQHVSPSRDYTYTLYSRDLSGNLSDGLVQTGAVDLLPDPSQISLVTPTSFDAISLSWTRSLVDDFAFYRLYRSEGLSVDESDHMVLESSTVTDTTFIDTDLVINQVYRYRLYIYDQIGQTAASGSQAYGAQITVDLPNYSKDLLLLPEPGRVLASDFVLGEIFICDDTGAMLDNLSLGSNYFNFRWQLAAPGQIWGHTEDGYLTLVDLAPLALDRGAESGLDLSDLTWLGGDSLLLTMGDLSPVAPILYDGLNMTPLDTLDILEDMAQGCLLASRPGTGEFFIAETGEDWTLSRVSYGSDFAVEESVNLPQEPEILHLTDDGRLMIAYQNSDRVSEFVAADLEVGFDLQLEVQFTEGSFTPDGSQFWGVSLNAVDIRGYQLDFPGGEATVLAQFDQVTTPYHCVMIPSSQRVMTALTSGDLSICQFQP